MSNDAQLTEQEIAEKFDADMGTPTPAAEAAPAEPAAPAEQVAAVADVAPAKSDAKPAPAAASQPVATEDQFDVNSLSPAARKAWEALEAKAAALNKVNGEYNALKGTAAAAQRKLDQLERARSQPNPQRTRPAPTAPTAVAPALRLGPKWDNFKQQLPDEAEAIEGVIASVVQQNQGLASEVGNLKRIISEELPQRLSGLDRIYREREQAIQHESQGFLAEAHPDWRDHFQLSDDGAEITFLSGPMEAWLEDQNVPYRLKEMLTSDDPRECKFAMDQFKATLQPAKTLQTIAAPSRVNPTLAAAAVPRVASPSMSRVDPASLSDAERFDMDMGRQWGKTA